MGTELEEKVRERAYAIWDAAGRPLGLNREHWEQAMREIQAESDQTGHQAGNELGEAGTPGQLNGEPILNQLPSFGAEEDRPGAKSR